MSRFFNPFSRKRKYSTQLELSKDEITSLKNTIDIMKIQRDDILTGQKAVTNIFQKALDLSDYVNDRFEVSHKKGDIEKKPVPIPIPKGGADISDVLENLVSEGEFEIPFMGKKGKGMIIAMIRKNKNVINEKAQGIMENAIENAQNPEELSKEAKEDLR